MKNEHKIDYVSIHEDGDMTQRSFGEKGRALERGFGARSSGPIFQVTSAESKRREDGRGEVMGLF